MNSNNQHYIFRIVAGIVVINLLVFALSGYSLYSSKIQCDDQARIEAENLAQSLDYSIHGIIDKIDLALWTGKSGAEWHLKNGTLDKSEFDALLANTLKKIPELANLRMADAKGNIIYGVESETGTVANIADRDYFTVLREDTGNRLYITKPILGRITKKWIIIIARRVNNPDGSFAGVIHANIPVEYLKKLFSTFQLGKHGMITLRDNDLSIIARYPETEKSVPGSVSVSQVFMQKVQSGQTSGSYMVVSKVDGIERIIAFRKIDIYPIYVNCGLAKSDYRAPWHREIVKQLVFMAIFASCTLYGARFILKSWKLTQRAMDDLGIARDQLENRVEERTKELTSLNGSLSSQWEMLQQEVIQRKEAQEELLRNNLQLEQEITSRKHAENERNKLEDKMQQTQKLESLGVLAGGIAHDFNNILLAIIGNAELALMKINPESPVKDNLLKIEQASARAADLAKQMLAYSGKGKFVVEPLNLGVLLNEMLHMLQVSISKKAVLRLNLTENLPTIEGDATQMRQIFMNLVINASEAIGDKSGVIAITTGCMDCDHDYLKNVWLDDNIAEGLYVFVEVSDSGCGMDNATLHKMFDPFFTTKFTGRGLGMSAVLGIVRGHKGAIKVYSEPGKGSTFKILFPASEKPAALFDIETKNLDWRGSGTVLLVDDEETVRGIGTQMLVELGFDVVTAEDGREAIDIVRSNSDFSFVILDLTMPHIDGEQCFRELRTINPDLKIIMSSGFNEQEVTQKFIGKGMTGFIQKPYKLSVLRDEIRRVTAQYAS